MSNPNSNSKNDINSWPWSNGKEETKQLPPKNVVEEYNMKELERKVRLSQWNEDRELVGISYWSGYLRGVFEERYGLTKELTEKEKAIFKKWRDNAGIKVIDNIK